MSEPGITPLAQRLAEENNVDWRTLPGSGEAGRIVERDVLEYLARVMAGEEATDPTPEPLPEGLQAWPEQDGWAGDRIRDAAGSDWHEPDGEAQPASPSDWAVDDEPASPADWAADHEPTGPSDWIADEAASDFGTPVAFDAEAAELKATGEYSADDSRFRTARDFAGGLLRDDPVPEDDFELELSEDIFLLDDDGPPAQEPGEFLAADEEDLLVADDSPETGSGDVLTALDEFLDDAEYEDADLTDLALEDGELDDPVLGDESLREFEAGTFHESLEQQAESEPAAESAFGQERDFLAADAHTGEVGKEEFDIETDADTAGDSGDEDFDIDFGALDEEAPADDWQIDGGDDSWQDAVEFAADVNTGNTGDSDEAEFLARRIEAAFDSVADSRPEFEHLEGDEPEDAPSTQEQHAAADDDSGLLPAVWPGSSELAEAAPTLPLANFGSLLRRQLDVSQLSQAQALVGTEIAGGDSISALAFLLRGARRAAAETGLFADSDLEIAAAVITESGIELVTGSGGGFRALAQQLQQVTDGGQAGDSARESLALAVADMSGLEVDEAILDLGVPMLSLGRILHDEGTGSFRSTLTLSGHFDIKEGARFLQVASELLANPLRLLL